MRGLLYQLEGRISLQEELKVRYEKDYQLRNSYPKKQENLGKHKNNIITGTVTQNMVLVDCCTIFLRASISPEE